MSDEISVPPASGQQQIFKGTAVSPGIAIGPLLLLYADEHIIR